MKWFYIQFLYNWYIHLSLASHGYASFLPISVRAEFLDVKGILCGFGYWSLFKFPMGLKYPFTFLSPLSERGLACPVFFFCCCCGCWCYCFFTYPFTRRQWCDLGLLLLKNLAPNWCGKVSKSCSQSLGKGFFFFCKQENVHSLLPLSFTLTCILKWVLRSFSCIDAFSENLKP